MAETTTAPATTPAPAAAPAKGATPAKTATTPATGKTAAPAPAAPKPGSKDASATAAATQAQVSHVETQMTAQQAADTLYEITVNGETKKVPLEVLKALAQKADGADAKFRQASEQTKRLTEAVRRGKEDPSAVLRELGIDPEQYAMTTAEKALKQAMEDAELSPEARELREVKRKLAEREAKEAETQKAETAKKQEAARKANVRSIGQAIYEAVEKTSLPHTDETALLMAQVQEAAWENGLGDLSPAQLAFYAEQQEQGRLMNQLKALASNPERLLKMLPPEVVKAITAADMAPIKKAPGASPEKAVIRRETPEVKQGPKTGSKKEREAIKAALESAVAKGGLR